jgi:leucyl aminopeptidase (aminopeptidase T)
MISLGSDRLTYRLVAEVPERFDSQAPALQLATAELFDAVIGVAVGENPDVYGDIPPERMAVIDQAAFSVAGAMAANGVRRVNIGNEMYPTPAAAARLGLELGALEDMFWAAVYTDPAQLQETAARVRQALEAGREVRLTHPNGTDLTFGIQEGAVFVSDGVVSQEDQAVGGAALSVWLPAGEVFLAPDQGTASGQLVIDREFWEGEEVRNVRMTFENGRMTALSGEGGIAKLRADYDASGACKELFGVLDVGINPALDPGQILNWMPAGMVTLGIGSNIWAGGEIDCEFSFNPHLPGATLMVDGVPVLENGELS